MIYFAISLVGLDIEISGFLSLIYKECSNELLLHKPFHENEQVGQDFIEDKFPEVG